MPSEFARPIVKPAVASIALMLAATSAFADSGLIINEYNAVSDTNFLTTSTAPTEQYKGYDLAGIGAATAGAGSSTLNGRPRDGRIKGNGGNWVELVVTQDHFDARGWSLEWSNTDPDGGSFTFNSNPVWSNLRAGTIITVIEDGLQTPTFDDGTTGAVMNLDTNTSFNPSRNDWWINVDVDDASLIAQTGFKVDNDNWQGTLKNASGQVKFGPVGESVPGWGGGGISSTEAASVVSSPSATISNVDFDDQDYTTFGAPNRYSSNTIEQDFSSLRGWWTNRLAGDANVDGKVDIVDLGILAGDWQGSGLDWFGADFNDDGKVDIVDLGILASNWQQTSNGPSLDAALASLGLPNNPVPEPTSIGAVAVAGIVLAGRRQRQCSTC